MKSVIRLATAVLLLFAIGVTVAVAQEPPKPGTAGAAAPPQKAQIPLKIQLVLSRYQGEKKISSVPYSLFVTTNEGRTSLRMSVRVPYPQGGDSFSLADVGTNIDCTAEPTVDRTAYKLSLVVTDSSMLSTSALPMAKEIAANPKIPPTTMRNFTSTFNILLRDGQSAQYTTATDPVSGEVLKIDATLNVLK